MSRHSSPRSPCSTNDSRLNDRRKSASAARDFIAGRRNVSGGPDAASRRRAHSPIAIQTRNTAIARIQSRMTAALVLFAGGESIARTSPGREVDRAVRQPKSGRVLAGSLHFVLACPQDIILAEIDLVELRTPLTAREARRSPAYKLVPGKPLALARCPWAITTRQLDAGENVRFSSETMLHARTRLSIAGGFRQTRHATPGPRHGRHRRSGIHRHRGEIIGHDVRGLLRANRSAKAGETYHRACAAPDARLVHRSSRPTDHFRRRQGCLPAKAQDGRCPPIGSIGLAQFPPQWLHPSRRIASRCSSG